MKEMSVPLKNASFECHLPVSRPLQLALFAFTVDDVAAGDAEGSKPLLNAIMILRLSTLSVELPISIQRRVVTVDVLDANLIMGGRGHSAESLWTAVCGRMRMPAAACKCRVTGTTWGTSPTNEQID